MPGARAPCGGEAACGEAMRVHGLSWSALAALRLGRQLEGRQLEGRLLPGRISLLLLGAALERVPCAAALSPTLSVAYNVTA